jgi:hypothetical protein
LGVLRESGVDWTGEVERAPGPGAGTPFPARHTCLKVTSPVTVCLTSEQGNDILPAKGVQMVVILL